MNKVFTNYRFNRYIDRAGVNELLKNIHKRTISTSVMVFNSVNERGEMIQENWFVNKKSSGKFSYRCLSNNSANRLKTSVINSLVYMESVTVILICDMKQKLDKDKFIKEMWGFRVIKNNKKTKMERITSDDIYKFSTTNVYTGEVIPPQKEMVYCGPGGKICGWDIIS